LVIAVWGNDARPVAAPGWLGQTTGILGAHIPNDQWLEIATAVAVLIGLNAFLRRTRYGLIIRAGVENRAMVTALGIDVRRAFTLVFAIGGMCAALAGVLSNVYFSTVDPQRGTSLLIFAFIVVVIGGLGSLRGTAGAAVVVGLVQQYANYYASSGLGDLSVVLLLGLVLLARPGGLSRSFAGGAGSSRLLRSHCARSCRRWRSTSRTCSRARSTRRARSSCSRSASCS